MLTISDLMQKTCCPMKQNVASIVTWPHTLVINGGDERSIGDLEQSFTYMGKQFEMRAAVLRLGNHFTTICRCPNGWMLCNETIPFEMCYLGLRSSPIFYLLSLFLCCCIRLFLCLHSLRTGIRQCATLILSIKCWSTIFRAYTSSRFNV